MHVLPPAPLSHPSQSRRQLFSREPGWQFSLMLALDVVFLFVAVPALSAGDASREVVTSLQLLLAATAIALLAKSTWFRVVLATSFGLTLLSHLLSGLVQQATTVQREIRVGMTNTQVAEMLGAPNMVTTDDERREVWVYDRISTDKAYSSSAGGAGILILGVAGSTGASSVSQRTLTVVVKFDGASRVRDFSYRSSSF